jgi:hypothetical protein
MVFVNHSAINDISTTYAAFCEERRLSIENVMRRSVLISSIGEKERNRFFNGTAGGGGAEAEVIT